MKKSPKKADDSAQRVNTGRIMVRPGFLEKLDKRKLSEMSKWKRQAGETERNLRKITNLTLSQKAAFRFSFSYAALNLESHVESRRLFIHEYLERLRKKISRGRWHDLWEVVILAREATRLVNDFALQDPVFVSYIADRYEDWPMLEKRTISKSRHSDFFAAIHLGEKLPKQTRLRAVLAGEHPARTWAARLWETLDHYRELIESGEDTANLAKLYAMGMRDVVSMEPWIEYPYFADVMDAAGLLPKLDPDSPDVIKAWWEVAKRLFKQIAGEQPWEADKSLGIYSKSKKATEKRRDINKAVRQAFLGDPR